MGVGGGHSRTQRRCKYYDILYAFHTRHSILVTFWLVVPCIFVYSVWPAIQCCWYHADDTAAVHHTFTQHTKWKVCVLDNNFSGWTNEAGQRKLQSHCLDCSHCSVGWGGWIWRGKLGHDDNDRFGHVWELSTLLLCNERKLTFTMLENRLYYLSPRVLISPLLPYLFYSINICSAVELFCIVFGARRAVKTREHGIHLFIEGHWELIHI